MQCCQRMIAEPLEELIDQGRGKTTDIPIWISRVASQQRPAGKIDHHAAERFVQGNIGMSVATDPSLVAQGAVHGLAQSDTDIFYGMVIINVQISFGGYLEIHQAMSGYLLQHVLEERHSRVKFRLSATVQVQGNRNLCFSGISFDLGGSISHVKVWLRLALMNVGVVQLAAIENNNRWVIGGSLKRNSSPLPGVIVISSSRILKV